MHKIPSDPNPFKDFELLKVPDPIALLSRLGRSALHFVTQHHSIPETPQKGAESFLAQQLFTEDISGSYYYDEF